MVPPPVITLDKLRNELNDRVWTQTVLDTIDFDAETDIGAFHMEDFRKVLIQLHNLLGVNEYDFAFYGYAESDIVGTDDPHTGPPDFATNKWVPLPNGTGVVAVNASASRIVTDNWTWILIRAKRTVAASSTDAAFYIRGE